MPHLIISGDNCRFSKKEIENWERVTDLYLLQTQQKEKKK